MDYRTNLINIYINIKKNKYLFNAKKQEFQIIEDKRIESNTNWREYMSK